MGRAKKDFMADAAKSKSAPPKALTAPKALGVPKAAAAPATKGDDSKTSTASRTATATRTATSTKTSTDAYTQGNVTVTGGAGAGATSVTIALPGGSLENKAKKAVRAKGEIRGPEAGMKKGPSNK